MTRVRKTKRASTWGEIAAGLPGGPTLLRRVQEYKIMESWRAAVGTGVAEQTKPKRVRNQVLEVNVSNSVWMQQLQFMKDLILEKLRARGSSVRDLRFYIGDIEPDAPPGGKEEGSFDPSRELEQEERKRIEAGVASIRDTEMREILSRLFARGLAAEKQRPKR